MDGEEKTGDPTVTSSQATYSEVFLFIFFIKCKTSSLHINVFQVSQLPHEIFIPDDTGCVTIPHLADNANSECQQQDVTVEIRVSHEGHFPSVKSLFSPEVLMEMRIFICWS